MRPSRQAETGIALVCLCLWSLPIMAENTGTDAIEAPSMELLEYLGGWGEDNDSLIDPIQLLELIESRLAEAPEEVRNNVR